MCTRSCCCAAPMSLWRKQWHPTPVLSPGKSHGRRSLVGCSPWGCEDFTFTFHFHALEKEMATHSSVLAWRIPGMGEHGGLPSMGSHRVGHDWSDLAAAACPFSPPVSSWVALTDSSPHTDGFLPPPSQPLCLATHKGFLQCLQSSQH